MHPTIRKYLKLALWLHIGLCLAIGGFLALYLITDDSTTFRLGDCFVRDHLHFYCPGCGGSRGLLLFFTGHPFKAFEAYPAYLFAFLIILWCDGTLLFAWVKNRADVLRHIHLWYLFIPVAVAVIWAPLRTYFALRFGYDPLGDLIPNALVFLASP